MQESKDIFDVQKNKPEADRFWFALYTRPRSEFKAAEQLKSVDISYYLPTVTKTRQWSDRKKKVTEPVMRGYIFIFATESERLLSVEQYSVARCVFDRGRPAKIPDWQIENLKKILNREADVIVHDGLIPGRKVLIKDGPFEGVIGIIQEMDNGKNSLSVSIDLLNRSIITHLPGDSTFELIREYNA